jgi:predicted SAM-dependent methyltransferase
MKCNEPNCVGNHCSTCKKCIMAGYSGKCFGCSAGSKTTKLNLGCGKDYREGWDNADLFAERVDLRFDFETAPYPINDNTYDLIRCHQVLEHLRYPETAMMEIYRMLKPGGIADILVPHYTTSGDWNFRHKSHFSTGAIRDYIEGNETQNEAAIRCGGSFKLIRATKKLRKIHIDVESFYLDFIPIWDSIHWIVQKPEKLI